jgi:predicted small secreted protein
MKKCFIMFCVLAGVFSLSACNTMRGLGQDLQKVGEKLEDSAQRK